MIINHIAFHACVQPRRVALINNGQTTDYLTLHNNIKKIAAALGARGIALSARVAVASRDNGFLLQMLLALEVLEAVPIVFLSHEKPDDLKFLAQCDWVITDDPHPTIRALARHLLAITDDWVQTVNTAAIPADTPHRYPPNDEAPALLLRTSGTTGQRRMVLLNRRTWMDRIHDKCPRLGIHPGTRFGVHMPLTVGNIVTTIMSTLYNGGQVVFETRHPLSQSPLLQGMTLLCTLPVHLRHLLDTLPPDAPKPTGLTIFCIGAPLPKALKERALQRLALQIYNAYGTNESSGIARMFDDGRGIVVPGCQVEIVDDQDRPLPFGTPGHVRLKSQGMATGYVNDPEATARMFRYGWLYPGDLGILHSALHLELLGRGDELVNLGGIKMRPEEVEDALRERLLALGVSEVAVCKPPDGQVGQNLWVVWIAGSGQAASDDASSPDSENGVTSIVATPDSTSEVARGVVRTLGVASDALRIWNVSAIPRNSTGKIERGTLRRLLQETKPIVGPATMGAG